MLFLQHCTMQKLFHRTFEISIQITKFGVIMIINIKINFQLTMTNNSRFPPLHLLSSQKITLTQQFLVKEISTFLTTNANSVTSRMYSLISRKEFSNILPS